MHSNNYSLGISPCPNDTCIFDALIHQKIDVSYGFNPHYEDVQTLNKAALEEELDMVKVSFHALLRITDNYWLLRSGSALGRGCGPLLIARQNLSEKELNRATVALPGELTTAHLLFRLAYPQIQEKKFTLFSEIEEAVLEGRVDAGVIIHENRFTYADKGLVALRDLGAFWEEHTGAPIPLGGIAVHRSVGRARAKSLEQALRQSVKYAFQHPGASRSFVRSHAQEMDEEICRKHIETYVTKWSEWLGREGKDAVHQLFEQAKSIGLIDQIPEDLYA